VYDFSLITVKNFLEEAPRRDFYEKILAEVENENQILFYP